MFLNYNFSFPSGITKYDLKFRAMQSSKLVSSGNRILYLISQIKIKVKAIKTKIICSFAFWIVFVLMQRQSCFVKRVGKTYIYLKNQEKCWYSFNPQSLYVFIKVSLTGLLSCRYNLVRKSLSWSSWSIKKKFLIQKMWNFDIT